MKTSKGNVRCRFGRLLSGVLSAAMLFTAAAFQIPVSADEETGGYEVLYDFVKDGYQKDDQFSDNGIDIITEKSNWGNRQLVSNVLPEAVSDGKVRFHFEFMHEYTWRLPQWYIMADEDGKFEGKRWYGLSEKMTDSTSDEFKIGYFEGIENNSNIITTNAETFKSGSWYAIDTIYDLTNGKAYYYINGSNIGESSGPKTIAAIGIRLNHEDISAGVQYFKNMKLDTGMAAEITDTNDNGAVLEFTQPIDNFDESAITVKCLETGEEPTVTVTKVNDMKYNLSYSTGTNIGGDYTLTFGDAFATINGISEKTIVYSQKPSVSYDYYINDDFEGYTVEGAADSRNAEGSTFWTKNPGVSSDMIAKDGGSGVAGNSMYAVTDGENKVLKLDGSVVTDKSKPNEVGAKYALKDCKTTDNNWNTNTAAIKGKLQINFDVKNVAQPNDGVTATTPPVFTLATNPYFTKILGITNDTLYIYSKADGTMFDAMPSEDQIHTLTPTATGFHAVEISLDFDKNIQTINVDGTQYYTGIMYPDFKSNGLSWLRFIQLKHSKSTEEGALNEWSTEDYGKAYTLIDNLNVINIDSASTTGIKSVQYSSDGINYSPAVDKVDSATKYVKIDFTEAMSADTLENIKLMQGSTAVGATGAASTDKKTYTLTLTDNLAVNTEYTLNIPITVKTSSGNSLARAYAGKITTTAGTFKIDLLDIQKGSNTVTTKNEISANDTLNAVVKLTNTEGREGKAYLCICVYNDDVMTQVNFDKINLKTESTKSVPITVASTANIKVKAFLWENFATMKPLVKNKTVE